MRSRSPVRSLVAAVALAGLAACSPAVGDGEGGPDRVHESDTGGTEDTAPRDTGTPWWEDTGGETDTGTDTGTQTDDDADDDGYDDGEDCDDLDPDVHPGAADACDGADQDCDGSVDEDFAGDAWEPNDTEAAWLGEAVEAEPVVVFGYVFGEDDADGFAVNVEDSPWSWFSVEAWLYGVPADADYALEIHWVADADGADRGVVATADEAGAGGSEVADWGGLAGEDNSGRYEVWVTSTEGAECATAYTLEILVGGW